MLMRASSVKEASSSLRTGVDAETAARLWHALDTDRNGYLDRVRDSNGDGKVQESEWIRLATQGIEIDFEE